MLPLKYMLVKIEHDVGFNIQLPGLPPSVVPIEPVRFTVGSINGGRGVTLEQFPATLAYVMTDYRCQGQTFTSLISDIKRPTGRGSHSSPSTSAYVQLFRCKALARCSIIRNYDDDDHPIELIDELAWQERIAWRTIELY
jgi:hypothetical protein